MANQKEWLFPINALHPEYESSPEASSSIPAATEALGRGIEYLFRVGVQLQLSLSAILTASTYFHRFYARNSIFNYPPTCVASAAILIASKSEECGRRLKDVAMVCMSKASTGPPPLEDDMTGVDEWQSAILRTEDLLLEVLGFDFAVQHPHALLATIFNLHSTHLTARRDSVEDLAWSITTDSYRTPLCVLFDSVTIACACLAVALTLVEGKEGSYLDRLLGDHGTLDSSEEDGISPEIKFFNECIGSYNPVLRDVRSAVAIILQFYRSQWLPAATLAPGQDHFLAPIANLSPPGDTDIDTQLFQGNPIDQG